MNRNLDTIKIEPRIGPGLQEAYRLVGDEIDQLRQARRAIDVQIQKAEAAQGLLRQLLQEPGAAVQPTDATTATKRFHKGSMTAAVVERCKDILSAAGRPLDRTQLLVRLEETGFTLSTAKPARFIGRTLWGNPDFVHIPRLGYWIAGAALPSRIDMPIHLPPA